MTGAEIYNALLQRGYSPAHAAALGGHMLQESGGDPSNVNAKEDAHGLLQWRLDRWRGLQNYALSRKSDPTDPNVQLDYVAHEMSGPEAKSGAAFMAAPDLPSASAALKGYIRFGDNSDAARLNYGRALLEGKDAGGGRSSAPVAGGGNPVAPDTPPAPEDPALLNSLKEIPKQIAASQVEAPQINLQPAQPVLTPAMIRARQFAAAMLARPLGGPDASAS